MPTSGQIERIYLGLTLLSTLAASFIWGINTLFLLDAGLTNTEAFAANAFFTLGQVIFEVPTGVIADMWGRRTSYVLGTVTLALSTVLYLGLWQVHASLLAWAIVSILLGLGFTFFSGATEAWLVDALKATGYTGALESVFAKGQVIGGIAMLAGSVAGGLLAQHSNLGLPYLVRAFVLVAGGVFALLFMRDLGFMPQRGKSLWRDTKRVLVASIDHGLRNPPVRWVMLAGPFGVGVSFYAFYAAQPYLLQLYGDTHAYGVAGLAAAIVALAQIAGGLLAPTLRKFFRYRTSALLTGVILSAIFLAAIGFSSSFAGVIVLLVLWGLVFAAVMPIRQTYLNGLISSEQRATVLSFDSLIGSAGGVVVQPVLGKVADLNGYPASYGVSAVIQLLAAPFILRAKKLKSRADEIER